MMTLETAQTMVGLTYAEVEETLVALGCEFYDTSDDMSEPTLMESRFEFIFELDEETVEYICVEYIDWDEE